MPKSCVLAVACCAACIDDGADVHAATWLAPPLDSAMLVVTVRDGGQSWQWRGADFRSTPDLGMPHSGHHETRTHGTMDVAFALVHQADTITSGQVSIPLRIGWRWRVDFMNATSDPIQLCFGCFGSVAFALPPAYRTVGRDSLWVVWGGNSRRHPVTY